MEEKFIADDGTEVTLLARQRSQSLIRLAGSTEVHDHNCFDFNILRPIPQLSLRWNRAGRVSRQLFSTARYFLSVASLTIITNRAAAAVSQSTIDRLGPSVFLTLAFLMQFAPVPFLAIVVLQFNNVFAETVYYKYLSNGAIIDFPESVDRPYLCSHVIPLLFSAPFAVYTIFVIAIMFVFGAPFSHFVVVISSLAGMMSYWYAQQGIEDKLISLSEFIQSFPDGDGDYGNIDRHNLGTAAEALRNLKLLEGRVPSYDGYWRRSYFKSIFAETKSRVGLSFGVKALLLLVMGSVVVYALFLLSIRDDAVWASTINPCIDACIYDDSLRHGVGERCSGCICRCLQQFQVRNCECVSRLTVPNCTVGAPGVAPAASLCLCPQYNAVQCL